LANQIEASKFPSPQLDLIDTSALLLSDLLEICDDRKNQASYQKIIKIYPETLIRMALSETHQAHLENRIKKTQGAYFTEALKRLSQYHAQA